MNPSIDIWRRPLPQRGMIRSGPLTPLPALLSELGSEPGGVLRRNGLSETALDDPERPIAFEAAGRLLADCAVATACPHFGLLLGERSGVATLGAVGFLAHSAPDVRSALQAIIDNLDLHDRGGVPTAEFIGNHVLLCYELCRPGIIGAEQIHDCGLAITRNIMRGLSGPDWQPLEIRLRRRRPGDIAPYRHFFRAPVIFDSERNGMLFDARWLAAKVQTADPLLHRHFRGHIAELREVATKDFVEHATHSLSRLIGARRCSLPELASELAMHPRTLARRLEACGTSFRELQRAARRNLACHLLRDTRSSIASIASLLGFSGSTAFNRAFAQWEGLPPATWRRRVNGTPPSQT